MNQISPCNKQVLLPLSTSSRGGLEGKSARLSRKSAVARVALMMISFRGTALPCWASWRLSGTMRDSSPARGVLSQTKTLLASSKLDH